MAIQIIQIPTENTITYTGTGNTYSELVGTHHPQILPVTIKQTADISSLFKVKFLLRVYKDSISSANLLATLKQRPNNFSTTTDSVAIFDIKGILNTELQPTFRDSGNTTLEVHKLGRNTTSKIFSFNNETVETIILKATWERSTTEEGAPEEQTGGTDEVQITTNFTPATFDLMFYNDMDYNPLDDLYALNSENSFMLTDAYSIMDTRQSNSMPSGPTDRLEGRINYVSYSSDFHTMGFLNKIAWGSKGEFMALQYFTSTGTEIVTYTFENETAQGGEPPSTSTSDNQYLIYAGVGTANLNNYTGACFKDDVALANFDGHPTGSVALNWAYYRIYMCDDQSGKAGLRSIFYYFVRDNEDNTNCKGQEIIRLGWINSVGAWDYYNFRGGQIERTEIERKNYSTLLGTNTLDSGETYSYNTWEAGTRTLYTKLKLKTTLQTQLIEEGEGQFLESLFNSNTVMVIEKGTSVPVSQSVVVSNKSFERKTGPKNKVQIQYTFDIEYANQLNTNS
jgi:hypothetical protein